MDPPSPSLLGLTCQPLTAGELIPLSGYPQDRRLHKKCPEGFGQVYRIEKIGSTFGDNGYVGLNANSLAKRLSSHLAPNSRCSGLRNAIQKHGAAAFTIQVIEDNIPIEDLAEAEAKYVDLFNTHRRGYNCTPGGESNPMDDPDVRARHKKIMSDPAFIERCLKKRRVTFALPEFKEKKSKAHKLAWENEEFKAKHSASLRDAWKTKRDRQEVSSQARARWDDPKTRESMKKAMKKAASNPAEKKRKSEASKAMWRKKWAAQGRDIRMVMGGQGTY